MIETKNLCYTYSGTKNGIHDLNIKINRGDMVAIIGKNGSGKTTLFNLITEYLIPTSGIIQKQVEINQISYCMQRQSIDWYLNVEQNINIASILYGGKKFTDIDFLIGLSDKRIDSVDKLSGGQQQRVQIGRALSQNGEVYLLDEPTVGLDVDYSKRMMDYLKQLTNDNKVVIISSHDLALLEKYCNKILYMKLGKLVYYGEMKEFIKNYSKEIRTLVLDVDKSIKHTFSFEFTEINEKQIKIELSSLLSISKIINEVEEKGYIVKEINTNKQTLYDILVGEDNE